MKNSFLLTGLFFLLAGKNCLAQTKPVAKIVDASIDSTGLLKWTGIYNADSMELTIEQLRNDKWIAIASYRSTLAFILPGDRKEQKVNDSIKTTLDPGLNKFRIKLISPIKFTSEEIKFVK